MDEDPERAIPIGMTMNLTRKFHHCEICGLSFNWPQDLKRHKRAAHNPLADSNKHVCPYCGKSFRFYPQLKEHLTTHTGDRPHVCTECGRGFNRPFQLADHIEKYHPEQTNLEVQTGEKSEEKRKTCGKKRQRVCGVCRKKFKSKYWLQLHKRVKHKARKHFVCEYCTKIFHSPVVLKAHIASHTGIKAYSCSECHRTFSALSLLKCHERIHKISYPHACPYCGKRYETPKKLNRHIQSHTKDPTFQCQYCSKAFTCPSNLKNHERSHTGEKPFFCNICHKSYSQLTNLRIHQRVHSGERPYQCKFCSWAFADASTLRKHTRTHTRQKIYNCQYCSQSYSGVKELREHKRLEHAGVKPYPCDMCTRAFQKPYQLKVHMRKHTGERPCVCAICEKGFIDNHQLNVHMRTHTGAKPYMCLECGNVFSSAGNLKIHSRIHSGERPYSCEICMKTFYDKSIMNRHMKMHTGDKPHVCLGCGKGFIQPSLLQKHMATCKDVDFEQSAEQSTAYPNLTAAIGMSLDDENFSVDTNNCMALEEPTRTTKPKSPAKKTSKIAQLNPYTANLSVVNETRNTPSPIKRSQHQCHICEKFFTQARNLKIHMNIHTGQRDNFCIKCNKSYHDRSTLNRHLRTYHPDERYQCECGVGFGEKKLLSVHVKTCDVRKNIEAENLNNSINTAEDFSPGILDEDHLAISNRGIDETEKSNSDKTTYPSYSDGNYYDDTDNTAFTTENSGPEIEWGIDDSETPQNNNAEEFPDALYTCEFCNHSFPDETSHRQHVLAHSESKPHICGICNQAYTQLASLESHVKTCTPEWARKKVIRSPQKPTCVYCEKTFSNVSNLNVHLRVHTGVKPYQCEKCMLPFSDRTSYMRHVQRESCQTITENYFHSSDVIGHGIFSKGEMATKESAFESSSVGHFENFGLANIKQEIDYDSTTVDNSFYNTQGLSSGFYDPMDMSQNMSSVRPKPVKNLSCEFCGKVFSTTFNLKVHVRIHTGEKPYSCDLCHRSFSDPSTYKKHQKAHARVKHTCLECGCEFDLQRQLKAHIKEQHKSFKTSKNSDSHVKANADDRSITNSNLVNVQNQPRAKIYSCPQCFQGALDLENFHLHLSKHSQEAGLTCILCGQPFELYTDLQRHIAEHIVTNITTDTKALEVSIKEFDSMYSNCKLCIRGFRDPECLRKHVASHAFFT